MCLSNLLKWEVSRLVKFIRLIENEYIKTLKKMSTKIMLIIVLVAVICLPILGKVVNKIMFTPSYEYVNHALINYQEQIEYYKSSKEPGWEIEVEKYQYLLDNKITIIEMWKFEAVHSYFDLKAMAKDLPDESKNLEPIISAFKACLDSGDYYKYCEAMILSNEYTLKNQGLSKEEISVYNWEYRYRIDNKINPNSVIWPQEDTVSKLAQIKIELYPVENNLGTTDLSEKEIANKKDQKAIYEYMLSNNITTNTKETLNWYDEQLFDYWSVLITNVNVVKLVGLLMILIAGGIVSNEFSSGTIKFLLINPTKRWKILMAKYFTVISLGYILVLVVFVVSLLVSGLICGFDNGNALYITAKNGVVTASNPYIHIFCDYLLAGVGTVVTATLAFCISSMVRSTALSVGMGLFIYLAGAAINSIIADLQFSWGRYLIFANLDLSTIINGKSLYFEHSVGTAVAVILIHLFVFLLTAWDGFTKREI